jgi:hypothetical protein
VLGKPAHLHSHREILAFDVAGGNAVLFWRPYPSRSDNPCIPKSSRTPLFGADNNSQTCYGQTKGVAMSVASIGPGSPAAQAQIQKQLQAQRIAAANAAAAEKKTKTETDVNQDNKDVDTSTSDKGGLDLTG